MIAKSRKFVLAALVMMAGMSTFAEWVDDPTSKTISNDKWRITLNNFTEEKLRIVYLEALEGNSDPKTLDLTELMGKQLTDSSRKFNSLYSNQAVSAGGALAEVETVIIPEDFKVYYLSMQGFSALKELKTSSVSKPHSISVQIIGPYVFAPSSSIASNVAGGYEFYNVQKFEGENIFRNCPNLTSIRIVGSYSALYNRVFYGCTALETVELATTSATLTIGDEAFYSGNDSVKMALKTCTLNGRPIVQAPEITKINTGAFRYCENLAVENVTLANCTTLSSHVFRGCNGLTGNVELPLLTSIGERTFAECVNLKGRVSIPKLTGFGNTTFGSSAISAIEMPLFKTTNQGSGLSNCDNLRLAYFPAMSSCPQAFLKYCDNLTHVVFPAMTAMQANEGLAECPNLQTVVLGGETLTAKGKLFFKSFGNAKSPYIVWNYATLPSFTVTDYTFDNVAAGKVVNYVRKEANWETLQDASHKAYVVDSDGELYFRKNATDASNQQPVKAMDTAVAVEIATADATLMKTIIPLAGGVEGELTLFVGDLFASGFAFTSAAADVEGVTAAIYDEGQHLRITVPASVCPEPSNEKTNDMSMKITLTVEEKHPCSVTITIKDESGATLTTRTIADVEWGASFSSDFYEAIVDDNYYFTKMVAVAVEPEAAAVAGMNSLGQATIDKVGSDAEVVFTVNRTRRPDVLDHWVLADDKYSMSDGVWTFRCNFNDGNDVIADATGYVGADKDVATVDFAKPILDGAGAVYEPGRLVWNERIANISRTSKMEVLNGSLATSASVIRKFVLPRTGIETIVQYGDFSALEEVEPFLPDSVVTLGDNAFANCPNLAADMLYLKNVTTLGKYVGKKSAGIKGLYAYRLTSISDEDFSESTALVYDAADFGELTTMAGNNLFNKTSLYGRFDVPACRTSYNSFFVGTKIEEVFFRNEFAPAGNCFASCTKLRKVIMPPSLPSVGNDIFDYSYSPSDVYWVVPPAKFTAVNNVYGGHDSSNIHTNYFLYSSQAAWQAALDNSSAKPTLTFPESFGAAGSWVGNNNLTQPIYWYLGYVDPKFAWDETGGLTVKGEVMATDSAAVTFEGLAYAADGAAAVKTFTITETPVLGAIYETAVDGLPKGTYKLKIKSTATVGGTTVSDERGDTVFYNGVPKISVRKNAITNANRPGSFEITREGPANFPLTVKYEFETTNNACAGLDFSNLSGSVTIPAGQSSVPIAIEPIQNAFTTSKRYELALKLRPSPYYATNSETAVMKISPNPKNFRIILR